MRDKTMTGAPGEVSSALNRRVKALLDDFVAQGDEVGVQVAAYLGDELVVDAWSGIADLATARRVDGATLFNVFSVVKAVTVTAVHMQAERGLLEYDAPIARYWPEFSAAGKEGVLVSHVLSHRSGLYQMPADVTPDDICNWDKITRWLAASPTLFPPGSQNGYQSMTMGWLCGELVRRTDPQGRSFDVFVREEICGPLGLADLWIGLPANEEGRVAILDGSRVADPYPADGAYRASCPKQVDLMPEPFGRSALRRACIPGVGGIMSARSEARFFAVLANGGTLDGHCLLSTERLRAASRPRDETDTPDLVFGGAVPVAIGGYWLGGGRSPVAAARDRSVICHPGMGGSIGFADLDNRLSFAFCHNRLIGGRAPDQDPAVIIANVVRAELGLI